jgi:hypothetical protein
LKYTVQYHVAGDVETTTHTDVAYVENIAPRVWQLRDENGETIAVYAELISIVREDDTPHPDTARYEALYDALAALQDPTGAITGLFPGPERDALYALIGGPKALDPFDDDIPF